MSLEREQVPIESVLRKLLNDITTDGGLRYLETMYDSLNPALIRHIVEEGKDTLKSINTKRGSKDADVYFTLGGDGWMKSLFIGFIAGILWTEDYIVNIGASRGVSAKELETYRKVLRKMSLPTIATTHSEELAKYGARTYAQMLANFVTWLSRASMANAVTSKVTRSNKEVVECLVSTALDSFPAIPFTAYHIGSVKCDEKSIKTIAEELSTKNQWQEYLSDQFISINSPKFVVVSSGAPLIGIVGHPLCVLDYGVNDGQYTTWMSNFSTSAEFDSICTKHGQSPANVREYVEHTSSKQFEEDVEKKHPIATLLHNQKISPAIFQALKATNSLVE